MNINELFQESEDKGAELPKPNVTMRTNVDEGELTEEQIRGFIANPIYAGIGPYPALVSDKKWVKSAAKLIEVEGREQFLVNLLYLLRKDFEHAKIFPE